MVELATHKIVSIAIGSNIKGYEKKCFVRKSSDKTAEAELVESFVNYLDTLYWKKQEYLRCHFKIDEIEEKLLQEFAMFKARNAVFHEYKSLWRYKNYIKSIRQLPIFGFNSGKFDLPVISGPLFNILTERGEKPNIIKKGSSYFSVETSQFIFKDVLSFTAPCGLDKFLRSWQAPQVKSIWPYSFFGSVEEIQNCRKFPEYECFQNQLNPKKTPSIEDYERAKAEFERRQKLNSGDPEKMETMVDWLRYYNELDVSPLIRAIENCFASYKKYFHVRPYQAYSLPSLASQAMFGFMNPSHPLIFSFHENAKEIHKKFRDSIFGGLVNVYKRHIVTDDSIECSPVARHAPNGEPYTNYLLLDFTSMYLSTQMKEMPAGPSIIWTRSSNTDRFRKKVSIPNTSFVALQWLIYMQETGIFVIIVHIKFLTIILRSIS